MYDAAMIRSAWFAIALGACGAERAFPVDAPSPADAPVHVVQPAACAQTITLAPADAGTVAKAVVGPLAIDATGVALCVELDATKLSRAHLMAGTAYEPAMASSFAATLERTDRTTIQDGWDVTVDDNPPRTMTNLEWSPPAGTVTSTILWVRARGATATTTIDMGLFDPLE